MNRLQKEILNVYSEIERVCEKNGIRYFGIAGTALGAVRHGGFIPWDDDMDIGIPICDFERFKAACKRDLAAPFEFLELNWSGGKVHNKNTTFLESQCLFDEGRYYGVFVDIFPLIGFPEDPKAEKDFLFDVRRFFANAFVFDRYPTASKLSEKEIHKWKNRLCSTYDFDKASRVMEFSISTGFTMDAVGLAHPKTLRFESTKLPVSGSVEKDLAIRYGEYLKLPPKNKRRQHLTNAIVDLNRPYSFYAKKIAKIDPDILELLKEKHRMEGEFFNYAYLLAVERDVLKSDNNELLDELSKMRGRRTRRFSSRLKQLGAFRGQRV